MCQSTSRKRDQHLSGRTGVSDGDTVRHSSVQVSNVRSGTVRRITVRQGTVAGPALTDREPWRVRHCLTGNRGGSGTDRQGTVAGSVFFSGPEVGSDNARPATVDTSLPDRVTTCPSAHYCLSSDNRSDTFRSGSVRSSVALHHCLRGRDYYWRLNHVSYIFVNAHTHPNVSTHRMYLVLTTYIRIPK